MHRLFRAPIRGASLLSVFLLFVAVVFAIPAAAVTLPGSRAVVNLAPATNLGPQDAVVGLVPASKKLHVVVSLKLRNKAKLDAFIARATKLSTPLAQRRLPPGAFLANYAPTAAAAERVAKFLRDSGFSDVTIAPNRLLVSAYGHAPVAEAAFTTSLRRVHSAAGEDAYANVSPIKIPADLSDVVQGVLGLQNVRHPHVMSRTASTYTQTYHTPVQLGHLYGADQLPAATNINVGVITAGDMSQTVSDFNNYKSQTGLQGTIQVVTVGSGSSDTSGVGEWNLDTQTILGVSGGVNNLVLYTADSMSFADLTSAMNAAVNDTTYAPKVVNMSFGACEFQGQATQAEANVFAAAVAKGITFSASTGDDGANCNKSGTFGVSDPASQPNVVAVGGTTLNTSGTDYQSESAWSGGGGGISGFEPKPTWQTEGDPSHRTIPDIAFDADPSTGAVVLQGSQQGVVGGTSLASPIFVGIWARLLQSNPGLTFAGPYLYTTLTAADYHDVTTGSNATSASGGQYDAGAGYDYTTGLGSFKVPQVDADIGQPGPPSISASFAPDQIAPDGTSVLTISLSNGSQPTSAATLQSDFVDTLPTGVVVAASPNAATTCNGSVQASAGGSTITLPSGSSIAAKSSCTVTVTVTAHGTGTYENDIAAGALHTDLGDNVAAAKATLVVGNGMTTPVASVAPGKLDFSLAGGASGNQTLNVGNTGGGSLTYSFAEAATNALPGFHTHEAFSFQVDDGSSEQSDALSDGSKEYAAIWLNRFAVVGPMTINSISVFWPGQTSGSLSGKKPTIVAYYDADGDGNPSNATLLYSDATVAISGTGSFQSFPVSIAVPGAGDVYVGFSDSWANGGTTPYLKPAAEDTGSPQNKSYIIYDGTGAAPNLTTLSSNDSSGLMSANLLIRATATSTYNSANCSSAQDIPWLSESPASGSVVGGHAGAVTVTANAGAMASGTYTALLCATTSDTSHSLIAVPVSLTITGGTPGNQAPTADFSFTTSGLAVTFTDASADSDGSVAQWAWDFGDGSTSASQNPSHTYAAGGTYTVGLTVTDNDGATNTITKQVTVSTSNQAPTAGFTYTANLLAVSFTDTSSDSDGTVSQWAWDFGDASTSASQNPSHSYAASGTYTVSLTVTDDDGATNTTSQQVTVSAGSAAPTLAVAFSPTSVAVGAPSTVTVTFNNPNATVATLTSTFRDDLPSGLTTVASSVATTCGGSNPPTQTSTRFTLPNHSTIPANGSCTLTGQVTAAAAGSYVNSLVEGALKTDAGNNTNPVNATLQVNAAGGTPQASITPEALAFSVAAGSSNLAPLHIANTGSAALNWSIAEAAPQFRIRGTAKTVAGSTSVQLVGGKVEARPATLAGAGPSAAPSATASDLTFQLDQGADDQNIGWTTSDSSTELQAIFLNRFTPTAGTGAYTIDTISILWPSQSGAAAGLLSGKQALLVAYYDADGDGDPSNATYLGQSAVTISTLDAFSTYNVSFSVPGDGDVYVGFADGWALNGFAPPLYPAALDQTSASAGRSYIIGNDATGADIEHLNNNTTDAVIDSFGSQYAGNWLIRATGTLQGGPTGSCANPTSVPWLSESATSGTVAAGSGSDVTITVDATGMSPGTYTALICVDSNDPVNPTIEVPVQMEVTGCASAPADRIFADGFGDAACTPPPSSIVTGNFNASVPDTFDGLALDFSTGSAHGYATGSTDDLNLFDSAGDGTVSLYWYAGLISASVGGVVDSNGQFKVLHSGDTVSSADTFSGNTQAASNWSAGVDGYLGVAFWNELTGELDYGYVHLTTTGPNGFPAHVDEYGFNSTGGPITIP